MKYAFIAAVILTSFGVVPKHGEHHPMDTVARAAKGEGVEITHDEMATLTSAHPALLKIARSPLAVRMFWAYLQEGSEPTKISWGEAQEMIMKGRVRSVSQAHDLTVRLVTENGVYFTAQENSIDEVYTLIKRVDPERVFISFATE